MNQKILFLIGSLEAGGAERVAARLCSSWVESGKVDVTLATGASIDKDFYMLASGVKRLSLGFQYSIDTIFGLIIEQFYRFISIQSCLKNVDPDIVILSTTDISIRALFSLLLCEKTIYVCEHNNYYAVRSKFKRICRLFIYLRATKLLLLTERDIINYTSRFFPRKKILVMPNPLGVESCGRYSKGGLQLLAVGRLCEQKSFHRLLEIFKNVNSDYNLKILGEGEEYESLQKRIIELNLMNRVELVGLVPDVSHYYEESSLLLMTSIYEGLPMVIGEANAFGLPVIAFNCPTGPAEMIDNGKNGYLIEDGDIQGFVTCVNRVLDDERLLVNMRRESVAASKKYSMSSISNKWFGLF